MHRNVSSSSKPRRRRTDDKLDLDELMTAPNLGGMLSFLEVPPDEARRRQDLRQAIDHQDLTHAQEPVTSAVQPPTPVLPTVGLNTPGDDDATRDQRASKGNLAGVDIYTTVVESPTVGIQPFNDKMHLRSPATDRSGVHDDPNHTSNEHPTVVVTPPEAIYPPVGEYVIQDPVTREQLYENKEAADSSLRNRRTLEGEPTEYKYTQR